MPVVSLILIITGCDPEVCNYYKISNKTTAVIDVLVYENGGHLRVGHSATGLKKDESYDLAEVFCGRGTGGGPFQSKNKTDSIVIIINDTIKVSILDSEMNRWSMEDLSNNAFGNNSPMLPEAWTEVKSKKDNYYYEYEFTEWHYQKALEANGYAVE
ncbi:hypothetical protein [Alkalitalea saponilacus]|nr:hypothetical protein [Alkalitalea saponilacus]